MKTYENSMKSKIWPQRPQKSLLDLYNLEIQNDENYKWKLVKTR